MLTDEQVSDLIQLAEHHTKNFQSFEASTLMGWFPKIDEEGRALNADPNLQWSICNCDFGLLRVQRKEWEVKLYVSSKPMTHDQAMSMALLPEWEEIATMDLTPTYLV